MTIGKEIAAAFVKAQAEMGNAVKDSTNPFFRNKYADLNAVREACLPVLNKFGISVLQPTIQIDGKNFVKTILLHESGETIESLTEILFAKQNDPQAQGSGITYARRYGLQSLVNIGAEDDDGNKAAEKPKNDKGFFKEPAGALANIAEQGDQEMQEKKNEKKADDAEKKQKAAEAFFAKVKAEFESDFGSLEEIQALEEKYEKDIKRLENYPNLHGMLLEAIDAAKMTII